MSVVSPALAVAVPPMLLSGLEPLRVAEGSLFVNVGERTNVTGSKAFARMILEGRFDDALAVAKRQGRLHRNFQGYSTQADCDLIALGVSSIGRIGATYSQNAKTLDEYADLLNQGHFPVVRGLALTRDDLIRRSVIMALMCQGHLQYESINLAWLVDFKTLFGPELRQLEDMQAQGLVQLSENGIQVTPMGWFFVRGVAMVFDRYLQADRNRTRFSKII